MRWTLIVLCMLYAAGLTYLVLLILNTPKSPEELEKRDRERGEVEE